jgi:hypothetical protein
MTLSLPPASRTFQLPDTVTYSSVQTNAVLNDLHRQTRSGVHRITRAGNIRKVHVINVCYPQVLGQVPNMSRTLSLPE